jgi:hypothetical protein
MHLLLSDVLAKKIFFISLKTLTLSHLTGNPFSIPAAKMQYGFLKVFSFFRVLLVYLLDMRF